MNRELCATIVCSRPSSIHSSANVPLISSRCNQWSNQSSDEQSHNKHSQC